jgi:hypothetical protein
VVGLYFYFPLSLRMVEEMLAASTASTKGLTTGQEIHINQRDDESGS